MQAGLPNTILREWRLVGVWRAAGEPEGDDAAASIGSSESSTDAADVSESASYEEGGEDPTTIIDSGGEDQSPSGVSSAGKVKFITIGEGSSIEGFEKY